NWPLRERLAKRFQELAQTGRIVANPTVLQPNLEDTAAIVRHLIECGAMSLADVTPGPRGLDDQSLFPPKASAGDGDEDEADEPHAVNGKAHGETDAGPGENYG